MATLRTLSLLLLLATPALATPRSDEDRLRDVLRTGRQGEDVFALLRRLSTSGPLSLDDKEITGALTQAAPHVRALLGSAREIKVDSGKVEIQGATPTSLRGAKLIPGPTLSASVKGEALMLAGVTIGPREGGRYTLHRVVRGTRAGESVVHLDVERQGVHKRVTLSASTLAASTAQPRPTSDESPVLRRGDHGGAVEHLQALLNRHRRVHSLPALPENGQFGPLTAEALRRFQRGRGLPGTGEANAATWTALRSLPRAEDASSAPAANPPLWQGDRGEAVRELQRRLNAERATRGATPVPVTARFDSATADAVRDLQSRNRLDATGVVDARAWEALRQPNRDARQAAIANSNELARGARGQAVTRLQNLLNRHRWNRGQQALSEDAVFGPLTQLAVLSFQRDRGLSETGRADRATWAALSTVRAAREGVRPARGAPARPVSPRTSGPVTARPADGGRAATSAPELGPAGNSRLDRLQRAVIESARHELSLGVTEDRGANRGTRVDLYARTAGMATGNQWCGFFASYNYTVAARNAGLEWAGKTVLHSVGKVRAFFLYRSYTQSWTRSNLARWEQTRAAHTRQGSTRRFIVLNGSSGHRYARSKNLNAEVYGSYNELPLRPGDIVLWSRGNGNGHIGLVEAYQGGRLTTIEGNTRNRVARRVYDLSSSSTRATIDGFCRPAQGDFR